jgi:hypothetical protein
MSIIGASIADGASSAAATGGTATTFGAGGKDINAGVQVIDTSETDLRIQSDYIFTNKPHALQSDGTYSKARRRFVHNRPKILSDDTIVVNRGRVEFEIHPESTQTEILNLRLMTAQAIFLAAMDDFYNSGTYRD